MRYATATRVQILCNARELPSRLLSPFAGEAQQVVSPGATRFFPRKTSTFPTTPQRASPQIYLIQPSDSKKSSPRCKTCSTRVKDLSGFSRALHRIQRQADTRFTMRHRTNLQFRKSRFPANSPVFPNTRSFIDFFFF